MKTNNASESDKLENQEPAQDVNESLDEKKESIQLK